MHVQDTVYGPKVSTDDDTDQPVVCSVIVHRSDPLATADAVRLALCPSPFRLLWPFGRSEKLIVLSVGHCSDGEEIFLHLGTLCDRDKQRILVHSNDARAMDVAADNGFQLIPSMDAVIASLE